MSRTLSVVCFVLVYLLATAQSWGQIEISAQDFAKLPVTEEGKYTAETRMSVYIQNHPARKEPVDANADLEITKDEIDAYKEAMSDPTSAMMNDKHFFGESDVTKLEWVSKRIITVQGEPEIYDPGLLGIQIARDLSGITAKRSSILSEETYKTELGKVKPAELSFSANNISGNDIWSARGALARPVEWDEEVFGGSLFFVPSVLFDRVSNSQDKLKDIDSLIFGAGANWLGSAGPIPNLEVRFAGQYATDFDFDKTTLGVALDIEPTFELPFSGKFKFFGPKTTPSDENPYGRPGVVGIRLDQFLHLEAGDSEEPRAISQESEYFRAGAGAGIDIYFPGIERLLLRAEYKYYWDALDHGEDYDNLKLSAQWQLDEIGHFSLITAYEEGLLPISMQEIDLFSVGFGVKF